MLARRPLAIDLFNRAVALDRELNDGGRRRVTGSTARRHELALAKSTPRTKTCAT